MRGALSLRNRQRVRAVNLRQLRAIILELVSELLALEDYDLTIHLVNDREMTELNQTHMRHAGTTDVITLDYSDAGTSGLVTGEIFVCVDEALIQARRFRTDWFSELVRYIVHGVLHLLGYDDLRTKPRVRMKKEEGRLLRELERRFCLRKMRGKTTFAA